MKVTRKKKANVNVTCILLCANVNKKLMKTQNSDIVAEYAKYFFLIYSFINI